MSVTNLEKTFNIPGHSFKVASFNLVDFLDLCKIVNSFCAKPTDSTMQELMRQFVLLTQKSVVITVHHTGTGESRFKRIKPKDLDWWRDAPARNDVPENYPWHIDKGYILFFLEVVEHVFTLHYEYVRVNMSRYIESKH